MHIIMSPPFIPQNATRSQRSFHTASGLIARRQTSIKPIPSIP